MSSQAQDQAKPMTNKIGQFTIREGYTPSQADIEFRERMTRETLEDPKRPPKPIVPTHFMGKLIAELAPGEKEAFYLSLQQKSTQDALERQKTRNPDDDIDWAQRPIPENYLANPNASTLEELTGERTISPKEYMDYKSMQRSPKNSRGQSELSSVTKESKKRAVESFTYSKPAELTPEQIKRVTKLTEFVSTALEPEKPKKGLLQRLFGKKDKPSRTESDGFGITYHYDD